MAINQAYKKPVKVQYIQLSIDTLDEALEFIDTLPRRAIWNHPTGGFSEWDHRQEGDKVGILVFTADGLLRAVVTDGSYIVKDREGDYLFMTSEQFDSQFDVPPVRFPDATPTPTCSGCDEKKPDPTVSTDHIKSVPTSNNKTTTTENTKTTTKKSK